MFSSDKFLENLKARFHVYSKPEAYFWAPLETFVVTLIAIGIGYSLMPDPLAVSDAFPWLLLAPLLIALRYTTLYGLVCNLAIMFVFKENIMPDDWFHYLIGSISVIILAGEFSHIWFTRMKRAQQMSEYATQRLDHLARAYYLTKLSHQRLERDLLVRPMSLTQVIETIRQLTIQAEGKLTKQSLSALLSLLSNYCGLISAGIFCNDKKTPTCLASIGEHFSLDTSDALVRQREEKTGIQYQTLEDLSSEVKSQYIAMAPIITSNNEVIAYFVIKDMSFNCLDDNTMQSLQVILSYYANDVMGCQQVPELLANYPDCPNSFALELKRMISLYKSLRVESYLVSVFIEKSDKSSLLLQRLTNLHHGLDQSWHHETDKHHIYFNLMPFSSPVMVRDYHTQIGDWLKETLGKNFDTSKYFHRERRIGKLTADALINQCLTDDAS